jgi:protein-disulfide isomerase
MNNATSAPRRIGFFCTLFCLPLASFSLLLQPCFGQSNDELAALKSRVQALEEAQKYTLKRLESIQKELSFLQRQHSSELALNARDLPARGNQAAKVALVEYFDYECPYCASFFDETMPQLSTDYVETGRIRFVARDFPLEANHPFALRAAIAAHCANEEGKFWPMHNELLGNSDSLDRKALSVYAKDIGLDVARFDTCVDSKKYAAEIKASEREGSNLGVEGTPTFFLGVVGTDGKTLTSVQRFDGAVEYAKLRSAIDRLIAQEEKATQPKANAAGYSVGYK